MRNKISKEGNKQHIGIDLLSIDISIDRDHGNAPYHVFLKMANPKQGDINDWSDLQNVFTEEVSAQSETVLIQIPNRTITKLIFCLEHFKPKEGI